MKAAFVASGILLSRLLGLVRESLKARYLGATGDIAADAFHAAFRIPNLLQNLFGEGALSASFIPVYSNALARGNREQADRIAGAIAALLGLLTALLVLVGVLFAPALVTAIAKGFEGEKRDLTVLLTRILFPGAALRLSLGRGNEAVRRIVRNFVPAFFARGVVQINAYVDQLIASFLPTGAVSLLFYTQTLTMLPISLFGIAVSAAELPEMASSVGTKEDESAHIRARLESGLRQIAFFVVPSAAAFLFLGDVITGALLQYGRFSAQDTRFTWGILAAASVGLLATTLGRLYSSAFYALHDTRTPLRIALVRVTLASVLGYLFAMHLPRMLGIELQWGTAALALSSSLVGWVEFTLLRSRLNARLGKTGVSVRYVLTLWAAAIAAGAAGFAVKLGSAGLHRLVTAAVTLALFTIVYLLLTRAFGVPESGMLLRRVRGAARRA
jgi:putative peptidoglycan lipid II flippase